MSSVTSLLPDQNHVGLGHKYMDHKNPWMDFNRQENPDYIPCKCLHRMQQPQSVLLRNLNSRDALCAVV